jgi:hypothetical protein
MIGCQHKIFLVQTGARLGSLFQIELKPNCFELQRETKPNGLRLGVLLPVHHDRVNGVRTDSRKCKRWGSDPSPIGLDSKFKGVGGSRCKQLMRAQKRILFQVQAAISWTDNGLIDARSEPRLTGYFFEGVLLSQAQKQKVENPTNGKTPKPLQPYFDAASRP